MNTSLRRTTVGSLTAIALCGGAVVASNATTTPDAERVDDTITLAAQHDDTIGGDRTVAAASDDLPDAPSPSPSSSTSSSSSSSTSSSDDGPQVGHEDRGPRTVTREDDDRREIRTEVEHVGSQTYPAADAGTVTVARDGQVLTIVEVTEAAGWRAEVERSSGTEVEVTFRRDEQRVDFSAEIESQWVKVRVRER